MLSQIYVWEKNVEIPGYPLETKLNLETSQDTLKIIPNSFMSYV